MASSSTFTDQRSLYLPRVPSITTVLPDPLKKYELLGSVREGSFGWAVFRGRCIDTNETVALKKIWPVQGYNGVPSSLIGDVSFLKEMEHGNIVRLLDVVNMGTSVYLVLEYMDLDLKDFMETFPDIAKDRQVIKNLLHQLLGGLAYCHSHNIVHRDLKPENLLIDYSTRVLKIADFESPKAFGVPLEYTTTERNMAATATLWYRAPEILLGDPKYSSPGDIWSAGCIFAEMVIQRPLFRADMELFQVRIFDSAGMPKEATWPRVNLKGRFLRMFEQWEAVNLANQVPGLEPAGLDLLSKMLCMNPSERITASDALNHPYFEDVGEVP